MYSRFVDLVIEGEIINRNVCQNRFVEEINEMPDQVTNDHPHQAAESLQALILLRMMDNHDQNTRNQTASESNVEDDNGENSDGEFDLEEIMISY